MTQPIVLAFDADGNVEYTRNSTFTPFDGRGDMQRVTDIRKRPDAPLYFIHWMLGPFAGQNHTYQMSHDYGLPLGYDGGDNSRIAMFVSYEAAVAHEIKMLNAMRRAGVLFHGETTETN